MLKVIPLTDRVSLRLLEHALDLILIGYLLDARVAIVRYDGSEGRIKLVAPSVFLIEAAVRAGHRSRAFLAIMVSSGLPVEAVCVLHAHLLLALLSFDKLEEDQALVLLFFGGDCVLTIKLLGIDSLKCHHILEALLFADTALRGTHVGFFFAWANPCHDLRLFPLFELR